MPTTDLCVSVAEHPWDAFPPDQQLDLLAALGSESLVPLPHAAPAAETARQVARLRLLARKTAADGGIDAPAPAAVRNWAMLPPVALVHRLRDISRWADRTWVVTGHLDAEQCQQYRSLGYCARYVADRLGQNHVQRTA